MREDRIIQVLIGSLTILHKSGAPIEDSDYVYLTDLLTELYEKLCEKTSEAGINPTNVSHT